MDSPLDVKPHRSIQQEELAVSRKASVDTHRIQMTCTLLSAERKTRGEKLVKTDGKWGCDVMM